MAVISEKYGSVNLHRFIVVLHLTETWRTQYTSVEFKMRTQSDTDDVFRRAREIVSEKDTLAMPLALPTPRGSTPQNASKRCRSWYERGPSSKHKRTYNCSLCGLGIHTAKSCALRQAFDGDPGGMSLKCN